MRHSSLVAIDLKFLKQQRSMIKLPQIQSHHTPRPSVQHKIKIPDSTTSIQNKSLAINSFHTPRSNLNMFDKFFSIEVEIPDPNKNMRQSVRKQTRLAKLIKSQKKHKKVYFNSVVECKDHQGYITEDFLIDWD